MVESGRRCVADELAVINGLNVFPVPDGDTGTNMLATLDEALAEAREASSPAEAARGLAAGAMMGSRGNSGVILAQVFQALSETVDRWPDETAEAGLQANHLAATVIRARELAYGAVSNPIEGTMLSVLSALAQAAAQDASVAPSALLGQLLGVAEAAVARTPEQLPILAEAGVIDSGGYGLLQMLRGWYVSLRGQAAPRLGPLLGIERVRELTAAGQGRPAELLPHATGGYGYCVTLLVEADAEHEPAVRQRLSDVGSSVLVSAAAGRIKLHAHVPDPRVVEKLAAQLGSLLSSEISNIDEQMGLVPAGSLPIVAVTLGAGLERVFRGLGAAVVQGGPGRNPSTRDLATAARDRLTDADDAAIFLLPNNGNVLAAARQAAAAEPRLLVVPATNVAQGVAAVLAYEAGATSDSNLKRMTGACGAVTYVELVEAVRSARIGGVPVEPGDVMVMLDGSLVGVGEAGLSALIERLRAGSFELVTIYWGSGGSREGAAELRARLAGALPGLEVEAVEGNQPYARYLLSLE